MISDLKTIKVETIKFYLRYRNGLITQEEYQCHIKPLDTAIDALELQTLISKFQDNPAYEISSSKHLH